MTMVPRFKDRSGRDEYLVRFEGLTCRAPIAAAGSWISGFQVAALAGAGPAE